MQFKDYQRVRETIIKNDYQALEWSDFFDQLDEKPPRSMTRQEWEQESFYLYQEVQDLTYAQACVFQQLLKHNAFDYVGSTQVRLMGIAWRRCSQGDENLPEPEGDTSVGEVSIQMADDLKDQDFLSRPKIDGVFFQGDGQILQGSFAVQSPILQAEFRLGKFYILDGEQVPAVYDGWEFVPHRYSKHKRSSEEGMMIKIGEKEYKWKFFPSVEIAIENGQYNDLNVANLPSYISDGIIEVYFSGARAVFLRERYHKKPQHYAQWLTKSSLQFYRAYFGMGDGVPPGSYDSVSWAHVDENDVIRVYPIPTNKNMLERQCAAIDEPVAHTEVHSAKASFRYRDGSLAVIKEPHKVWDFVGGVIEQGETPQSALEREMREEIGVALPASFLREEYRISNFVLYRTYFFELDPKGYEHLFHSSEGKSLVPWFSSYERALRRLKRTRYKAPVLEDMLDTNRKKHAKFKFDPLTYKWLSKALATYPSLAQCRRVQATERNLLFVGTYSVQRGKTYFEMPWEKLPVSVLCLWAFNNTHIWKEHLPFGMTKKAYSNWLKEHESSCFLCGGPKDVGLCQICVPLLAIS